jgi:hypothetical protein
LIVQALLGDGIYALHLSRAVGSAGSLSGAHAR